jgi:protein TonB
MLQVLLESKATRTRRVGSTLASALVHGVILTIAVALTVTKPMLATTSPSVEPTPIYIPTAARPTPSTRSPESAARLPRVPLPTPLPTTVWSPGDLAPTAPTIVETSVGTGDADLIGPGVPAGGSIEGPGTLSGPIGGVVDAALTDRAPRLLGRPDQPRYPSALRHGGRTGQVIMQFVVDTTGRIEPGSERVTEASDRLFADAVQAVLPRYRFSPGEARGQRVRTLVQMPFQFTIAK